MAEHYCRPSFMLLIILLKVMYLLEKYITRIYILHYYIIFVTKTEETRNLSRLALNTFVH